MRVRGSAPGATTDSRDAVGQRHRIVVLCGNMDGGQNLYTNSCKVVFLTRGSVIG